MNAPTRTRRQLAKDVLTMAATGCMPDTYWWTDQRIQRAIEVLDVPVPVAKRWAEWAADAGRR